MPTVTAEIFVQASVKFAYRAFTNSTSLREWLCNVATVEPRPRGRIYLWWQGDFYSSGHFIEVVENKKVVFQWFSNQDPEPTEVTVTVTEKEGGAHIKLDHAVPDDGSWMIAATEFLKNWESSLENLKSVLETGIDLRIANRPMLGILPGDFTPEQAAALGVPVRDGLRLDGVVDGMGAQKAGLQRDDVLVELAGKPITREFNSMLNAIAGKKGGDTVDVKFYRGKEKQTVKMQLGKRPMPEVPLNPVELAQKARNLYEPALAELQACFDDFSDEEAMKRPADNEWSALEVIAHLIQGERFNFLYLNSLIDGYEITSDGFGSNINASVEAVVKANPSVRLMLEALRRAVEELLAYTERIPQEFVENKGSYYRYGSNLLQPGFHLNAHTQQIKDALAAAR